MPKCRKGNDIMKNIIINNESTIKADGIHTNGSCKPVICIDTGEVFTSATDAAEKIGVHFSTMSATCLGKIKTCKGKRYCYLANVSENLDALTARIKYLNELEAKAKAWDDLKAKEEAARKAEEERLEAIRKAEEERIKAEQERKEKIAKHEAKLERRKAIILRLKEELARAEERAMETERELEELKGDEDNGLCYTA